MNDDKLITEVSRKIDREKILINAANAMRQSSNPQVQQSLDSQVREARRNIGYLEGRMRELQLRRSGQGIESGSLSSNGGPPPPAHGNASAQQRWRDDPSMSREAGTGYGADGGGYGDPGPRGYSGNLGAGQGMMPPRAPFGPPAPNSSIPKARPNYSKLGTEPAKTFLRTVC